MLIERLGFASYYRWTVHEVYHRGDHYVHGYVRFTPSARENVRNPLRYSCFSRETSKWLLILISKMTLDLKFSMVNKAYKTAKISFIFSIIKFSFHFLNFSTTIFRFSDSPNKNNENHFHDFHLFQNMSKRNAFWSALWHLQFLKMSSSIYYYNWLWRIKIFILSYNWLY